MTPFQQPSVAAVFETYPPRIRKRLLALREAIFDTAATTTGVGPLQETLKWGEPAYLTAQTKSGSTVRIDWKPSSPAHYRRYFICTTHLVDTFRSLFPRDFIYEGNRALVFHEREAVPMVSLRFCIAATLTYRLNKRNAP